MRRKGSEVGNVVTDEKEEAPEEKQEKTYVDEKGVRRCNLLLKNGRRCNTVVVEKEGRYGRFWSCSNYKEHAPAG
ncbi:MAG: hypothetical protein QMC90_01925 [Dehalococcoidales bacterium]|nr:hypothetical protein [Dehalococcoidales bacterium]